MKLIILFIVIALSACTHNEHRSTEATAFYNAQATARQPLFELTALPGETIELKGVASLKVNDPRAGDIKALPVVHSPAWQTLDRVLGLGAGIYGAKIAGETIRDVAAIVAQNSGDRSVHTDQSTTIVDSYNDSSVDSVQGDTISDSYNQDNDTTVSAGDGSAIGDGNDIVNGDNNNNTGQIGDNSNDGDECVGEHCQGDEITPVVEPTT